MPILSARAFMLLLLVLVIAGCGQQRKTAWGSGLVQKRKHLPGWHLDLGLRAPGTHQPHAPRAVEVDPLSLRTQHPAALPAATLTPANEAPVEVDEAFASVGKELHLPASSPPHFVEFAPVLPVEQEPGRDPDDIMPHKGFNVLAIPALVIVAAGITLAFVTNSALLVAVVLVVGLVLASISLSRIRSREQSGKGYALTALIFAILAALITTMVIIRSGF